MLVEGQGGESRFSPFYHPLQSSYRSTECRVVQLYISSDASEASVCVSFPRLFSSSDTASDFGIRLPFRSDALGLDKSLGSRRRLYLRRRASPVPGCLNPASPSFLLLLSVFSSSLPLCRNFLPSTEHAFQRESLPDQGSAVEHPRYPQTGSVRHTWRSLNHTHEV